MFLLAATLRCTHTQSAPTFAYQTASFLESSLRNRQYRLARLCSVSVEQKVVLHAGVGDCRSQPRLDMVRALENKHDCNWSLPCKDTLYKWCLERLWCREVTAAISTHCSLASLSMLIKPRHKVLLYAGLGDCSSGAAHFPAAPQ